MATIRQLKSGNWNVQIREKGNRLSRTFLNLEDAERFAKTGINTISFHSVCEQYIKLKGESVRYRVRGLMKSFDTPPTKLDLEHYKKFRLRIVKSSTARLDLQMLSRIVKFGIEQLGLDWEFPFNNFKYPPESKGRDRVITELEYDMLLGDLPQLVASAAALSYETAMRRGEVSRIAKGHIEFENNRLYIPESKNGHSRYVPLNTKAIDIFKAQAKGHG